MGRGDQGAERAGVSGAELIFRRRRGQSIGGAPPRSVRIEAGADLLRLYAAGRLPVIEEIQSPLLDRAVVIARSDEREQRSERGWAPPATFRAHVAVCEAWNRSRGDYARAVPPPGYGEEPEFVTFVSFTYRSDQVEESFKILWRGRDLAKACARGREEVARLCLAGEGEALLAQDVGGLKPSETLSRLPRRGPAAGLEQDLGVAGPGRAPASQRLAVELGQLLGADPAGLDRPPQMPAVGGDRLLDAGDAVAG